MVTNDERTALLDTIHSAFRGVERGEITIHEAEVIDDHGTSNERARARRIDSETAWEEIPGQHIEACGDALCHLDPQSWCYYLPRYMEVALQNPTSAIVDRTIYTLLLTDDRSLNDYHRARFRKLSQAQSEAVSLFLAYMASRGAERCDGHAASKALALFWKKFLPRTNER